MPERFGPRRRAAADESLWCTANTHLTPREESGESELRASLGSTELIARRDGTITWTGGHTRVGTIPWGRTLEVALVRDDLAILAICGETCAIVRARPGAAPEVLAADLAPGHPWFVAREGASGILVAFSTSDAVHALWLDRSGALVGRRTLAADEMLDEVDGQLVLIERVGDRGFALGPELELSPREVEAWRMRDSCSDDASGPERVALITADALGPLSIVRARWGAVIRGGYLPCIARVDAAGTWGGTLVPDGPRTLRGTIHTEGREAEVTCTIH